MTDLFYILISIIGIFFLLLIISNLFSTLKNKFCVICGSVFLTWVIFLILQFSGFFNNKIIISLLVGQSIVGFYYYLENKVDERTKLFRLPFLLTLTIMGYFLVSFDYSIRNIFFVLFIWIVFIFLYFYKNNKGVNLLVKKILECCRRW